MDYGINLKYNNPKYPYIQSAVYIIAYLIEIIVIWSETKMLFDVSMLIVSKWGD